MANAEISCEDAGGTLFKGNDEKTEYCLSYHAMNWWSANAWCQSLGWELIDLQTECNKRGVSTPATSACPQFHISIGANYGWSKNTSSSSTALQIYFSSGAIGSSTKTQSLNALCLVK